MSVASEPLILVIVLPLVGGALCLLMPAAALRLRASVAIGVSALDLVVAGGIFARGPDTLERGAWLSLHVDRLSAFVLLFVAVFGLLVAVYSWGYLRGHAGQRAYWVYLLSTLGAACAAVLANDLVLLLVCWGALAVTLYLMIALAGADAAEAARKSLVTVAGSDVLLLLGAVVLWQLTGTTRMDAGPTPVDGLLAQVAFLAFLAAAFAKAGAVPLHGWVPECAERAWPPVTALLPAALDKLLGIYLLARVTMDLLTPSPGLRTLLMALGALTVVVAVLMALVQHDLKRLLGYHAVSQVGYMVLGIGTGTAVGVAGALFHMLNHATYKSCLFLGAGAIERAAGSADLDRLGGLARPMRATFLAMLVASLAISGIPPLNGFASKWMIYRGIVELGADGGIAWVAWLAAAMIGSALTLASFVKVLHAAFLCPPSPAVAEREVHEAPASMTVPMLTLAALCIAFGVLAAPLALEHLVLPAVPGDVGETWGSGVATGLLLTAIGAGALAYWLTMRGGKVRRVETYVGGERLEEVYVRGEPAPPARDVRVTGVDFYRTVEGVPGLRRLYALTRASAFDLYEIGRRCLLYAVVLLRAAHTGALPAYLTWFLLGVLGIVYLLARGGP